MYVCDYPRGDYKSLTIHLCNTDFLIVIILVMSGLPGLLCNRAMCSYNIRSPTESNKMQTAEANLSNEFTQAKSTYEFTLVHIFASTNDSKISLCIRNFTNSHLSSNNLSECTWWLWQSHPFQLVFPLCFYYVAAELNDINTIESFVDNHLVSISISEGGVL